MMSDRMSSLSPDNAPCKGEVGGRIERLRAGLSASDAARASLVCEKARELLASRNEGG